MKSDVTEDANHRTSLLNFLDSIESFEKSEHFPSGLNFFVAAGLEKQEIRHSKILAFLLDPNKPHGLGDFFLKRLLRLIVTENNNSSMAVTPLQLALADLSDTRVATEQDHIDVLAWSESNRIVLAIENKVDAKEGEKQLETYRTRIEDSPKFKNYSHLFAFLTKNGIDGADSKWTPISWEFIESELSETLRQKVNELSANEKYFIEQYLDLIRRYIVVSSKLIDECRSLYCKHQIAIDLIIKHGEVSNFATAVNLFIKKHENDIKSITQKSNEFVFLPNAIYEVTPEVLEKPWKNQKRPFLLWFAKLDNKILLYAEVGPITNINSRQEFVEKLRTYFKSNRPISDKYTRLWRASHTFDRNKDITQSEDTISDAMEKLYAEFKQHIDPSTKLIKEVFRE